MSSIRIIQLPTETTSHDDDYVAVDSIANGTKKIKMTNFKDYVTPEMFGAKGDGIADDTQAIQTAIDTGKPVFFCNSYLVTSTLTLINNSILFGDGSATITYSGTGYLFDCPIHHLYRPIIEKMRFIGTNTNKFISVKKDTWGASVSIRDFVISNFDAGVMDFYDAYLFDIVNGHIYSNGAVTISSDIVDTFSNCGYFENIMFTSHDDNSHENVIIIDKSYNITFNNCTFERFTECINVTNNVFNITFYECWFEDGDSLCNLPRITLVNPQYAAVTKAVTTDSYASANRFFGTYKRVNSIEVATPYSDAYVGTLYGEAVPLEGIGFDVIANGNRTYLELQTKSTKKEVSKIPRNTLIAYDTNKRTLSLSLGTDQSGTMGEPCLFDVVIVAHITTNDDLMCKATIMRTNIGSYIVSELETVLASGSRSQTANPRISVTDGVLKFDIDTNASVVNISARYEHIAHSVVAYD